LFEHNPKEAFHVYSDTAAESLFARASLDSKKSFVNEWFVNLNKQPETGERRMTAEPVCSFLLYQRVPKARGNSSQA
jgi:hypothetical protein